ncbi:MAG TPA: GNAT family N-acetyltransferase [Labilithrix sp.]|nr:GNAT family N-acetyltransferase [Labilithrix sp.]
MTTAADHENASVLEKPVAAARRRALTPFSSTLAKDDPALYGAWKDLFEADAEAYTLQHPDWVLAESHTEGSCLLLQEWSGDRLAALGVLLPKTLSTRKVSGPGLSWTLRGLRLAGNRFLQREKNDQQLTQLLDRAREQVIATRSDFLLIEDLERNAALARACEAAEADGFRVFAPKGWQPRLKIDLPKTADEYWKKFSGKTRSTFRRKLKKFGTTRLQKVSRADEVAGFLAHAHEISKQTWQTRQLGLRVRNEGGELVQLEAAARAGLLRSYLWFVNDLPAAFLIGNQAHGVFNYEEVGYATAFAKNSPGQMMLLQVLDELFSVDTPHLFDFGGGDAEYKRMFSNHQSESGTIWLVPPGVRLRLILGYLKTYAKATQEARRRIAGSPWAMRLRQRVRYGGAKVGGAAETAEAEEKEG